jgi:DNA polymerase III epsilon subunit-like protein
MREIVIDTETTGLDPLDGHRVVKIGTVELSNRSQQAKLFTATYVRNATYQPTPSRCTGSRPNSSPTPFVVTFSHA